MFEVLFVTATINHKLPANLLSSICFIETRHTPNAIHYNDGGTNSYGICQVKLSTAKWLGYQGNEMGLLDPSTNVEFAARYLAYQLRRYGHVKQAVIAYNRGSAGQLISTVYSQKVFNKWGGTKHMSSQLMASSRKVYLPDALKKALQATGGTLSSGGTCFRASDIPYLEKIGELEILGAQELIAMIRKYDEVEVWLEY